MAWQNLGGYHTYKGAYSGAGLRTVLQYEDTTFSTDKVKLRFYTEVNYSTQDHFTVYFYDGDRNKVQIEIYPKNSGTSYTSSEFYCYKDTTSSEFNPGNFWICNDGDDTFDGRGGYTGYNTGARKNFKSSATGRQTDNGFKDFNNDKEGHGYTGKLDGPVALTGSTFSITPQGDNKFIISGSLPNDSTAGRGNNVTGAKLFWRLDGYRVYPTYSTGDHTLDLTSRTFRVPVGITSDVNISVYLQVTCQYGNNDTHMGDKTVSCIYHDAPTLPSNPIITPKIKDLPIRKNSKNAVYVATWSAANPYNGNSPITGYKVEAYYIDSNNQKETKIYSGDLNRSTRSYTFTNDLSNKGIKLKKDDRLIIKVAGFYKNTDREFISDYRESSVDIVSSGVFNVKVSNTNLKESETVYVYTGPQTGWKEATDIYIKTGSGISDWKESI